MVPSSSTTSMVVAGFEKEEECCICLSLFRGNEKLKVLIECEHVFHSKCLGMWLSAHPSCPLCRAFLHARPPLIRNCIFFSLNSGIVVYLSLACALLARNKK
ncbi:RING-H2 finger protein ATL51 [Glycine soja]|uniref:RING-type E3 ubiquitin transferase n=1 Tax=Glycine soja TaxID=3848 RepID=A0A0B2RF50_GLYSO|nr:RING-H2 finger protein ATL51 [Glycine soja]